MDTAYHQAAQPKPHRCLGLSLKPLTIGHLFLLDEHASPFVRNGSVSLSDILTAAFICADDFERSKKNLNKWWVRIFGMVWGWRASVMNVRSEFEKLEAYFIEATKFPEVKFSTRIEAESNESIAPLHWNLLTMLVNDSGMTEEQAMRKTVNWAICFRAAELERQGLAKPISDRTRALVEYAKRMDAEKTKKTSNN